jgi:uncharacterized protein DUF2281
MSIKDAEPGDTGKAGPEPQATAAQSEAAAAMTDRQADGVIELRAGSLAYALVKKLKTLTYDKQREALDFAEFLVDRMPPKPPRRSPAGLWADLGIHITEEDIAEARQEMWGNFPREPPD